MAVKQIERPVRLDRRWKHHDDALGNAAKRVEDPSPGPWEKWRGSRVARFVRFTEKYLRSPKSADMSRPLKLMPWQKEFAEAFLEGDYSEAILGMGRGGGKSTFLAALAMFGLFESNTQGAPSIPIVAKTLGQAKDSVFSQIEYMRASEPELKRRTLAFSGFGSERIEYPRFQGSIFPKAQDPGPLLGLNLWPYGFIDEIGECSPQTWNAVKMGRKRPGARILGAGTWGPDRDTALYDLRALVRDGLAPKTLLWQMYSGAENAPLTDEENWHAANPSLRYGYPNLELVRNEFASSPEALVRTFRLNEPDVTGHDSWLGPDARVRWNALFDPYDFEKGKPVYGGVDIGRIRDCSAVIFVQERPDGRLHAKARIWVPKPQDEVDLLAVSAYIQEASFLYDLGEVGYDPRFFELEAARLRLARIAMTEISQTPETMTPIVAALRKRIFKEGLSHDDDKLFGDHVVNAVARPIGRSYMLDKDKSASRGHIDACIGLSIACDRFEHRKTRTAVYVG